LWIEHPDPISGMLASMPGRQLCGQGAGPVLAESGAYREHFVGQNCVIFGERMAHDNRIKDAKPAGEQKRRRQRKEQNELECDGTWFIQ
jgi:hypothetical protein